MDHNPGSKVAQTAKGEGSYHLKCCQQYSCVSHYRQEPAPSCAKSNEIIEAHKQPTKTDLPCISEHLSKYIMIQVCIFCLYMLEDLKVSSICIIKGFILKGIATLWGWCWFIVHYGSINLECSSATWYEISDRQHLPQWQSKQQKSGGFPSEADHATPQSGPEAIEELCDGVDETETNE